MVLKSDKIIGNTDFSSLVKEIAAIIDSARRGAYKAVNSAMVQAYWQIGKSIAEYELKGKERADYGEKVIIELSKKLTAEYGKGFNLSNIKYMRQFYLTFPISHALRDQLSWTHYRLLLKVKDEPARQFYEAESINSRWSSRELERQINSLLFERLALSKNKDKILQLSSDGQVIAEAKDLIKDPYIFEFLDIADKNDYLEKDLEQSLMNKLQTFLLELGKGFAFVGRQKRITIDNNHYYVDLVFYNYILKCFVLIDLKTGKLTPEDVGKMDFYVRYFEQEERGKDDKATIGLVLCSDKNETIARYTMLDESKQIFSSEYKLFLPSEADLTQELSAERQQIEIEQRLGENSNEDLQ